MAKKVDIKDFPKVFKKYGEKLQERFKMITVESILKSIPELVQNSPVDTGEYASSWDFSLIEEKATIGNYAPHAPIIEFGARPHRMPLKPLLAWAKRVLQDPSQPPSYSPEVQSLARAVQRKIAFHGQQPKHVLTKQIPKIIDDIKKASKTIDTTP